jgi:outer membrane protein assembly factor BamB
VHLRRRTTICCRCFARITSGLAVVVLVGLHPSAESAAQGLPDTARWSVPIGAPSGAPVLAGSAIVVPLQAGSLAAHRLTDGKPLWTYKVAAEHPLASDADRVYVASGEALHALDAATGAPAWRVAGQGKVTAPPLAHAGWVIAAMGGEVLALRATDGMIVWRKPVGPVEFRPALDGDLLVVSVTDGRVLALSIQDGTERWAVALESEPTDAFVIGDRVYVGTTAKTFLTLQAKSGRRARPARLVGALTNGAAAADDRHVYFGAMDNQVWATDRADGAIEWRKQLPYRPATGPVLLDGVVVVPSYVASLPAFNARTGAPAGQLVFPAQLVVLPLFARTPDGVQAVVAITGANDWTLSMMVPSALSSVPAPPLQPLTVLPGVVVPPPRPPG